jgi:hypothetical protein
VDLNMDMNTSLTFVDARRCGRIVRATKNTQNSDGNRAIFTKNLKAFDDLRNQKASTTQYSLAAVSPSLHMFTIPTWLIEILFILLVHCWIGQHKADHRQKTDGNQAKRHHRARNER